MAGSTSAFEQYEHRSSASKFPPKLQRHLELEADDSPPGSRRIIFFDTDLGGIPDGTSEEEVVSGEVLRHNTRALSDGLKKQGSNAIVVFPRDSVFSFYNGVRVRGLKNSTLQIDGEIRFMRNHNHTSSSSSSSSLHEDLIFADPRGHPPACLHFKDCSGITLTSSLPGDKRAIINGGGQEWWGVPGVGIASILENRPYFILFNGTTDLTISNLVLQDSPYYNLMLTNVEYVHIHDISIVSRRTDQLTHGAVDLSAANTDGIDIAGRHVHVHDVDIWNQDDCIAIKDNLWSSTRISSNMTFERIYASGLGLTIGSISGTTVRDIVFRDCYLHKTFKGIYMKFRESLSELDNGDSVIENILYENITMESPMQWPIWIGPAQQTGGSTSNLCHASPCSLCWPTFPFQTCGVVSGSIYRNITLRHIFIRNPNGSPGVILGGTDAPIINITFDNVKVIVDNDSTAVDLPSIFPSLGYPVSDDNANITEVILYTACAVLFIWLVVWMRFYRKEKNSGKRKRRTSDAKPQGPHSSDGIEVINKHSELRSARIPQKKRKPSAYVEKLIRFLCQVAMVVLTVGMTLVAIQLIHLIYLIPDVDSPDYYFSCEGVQGGVATGDTYPIPRCFDDQTGRDQPISVLFISSFIRKQLVFALLLAVCSLVYYMTMLSLWQRSRCCHKRRLRQRRVAPGDAQNAGDQNDVDETQPTIENIGKEQMNDDVDGGSDPGNDDDDDHSIDDRSFYSFMSERTGAFPPSEVFSLAWTGVEKVEGSEPLTSSEHFDGDGFDGSEERHAIAPASEAFSHA